MSPAGRITIMLAATAAIMAGVYVMDTPELDEDHAARASIEQAETNGSADRDAGDGAQSAGSATLPSSLSLVLADGSPTTLFVDDTTDVVVMATWCSYSEGLKNLLNDTRAKQYEAHRRLIFVFQRSEWRTMENRVQRRIASGRIKPEAVASALDGVRDNARHSMHVDPSFFLNLPGAAVYWDDAHPITYGGTPQLLTGPGPHFERGVSSLLRRMGVPRALADTLIDQYYYRGE